MKLIKDIKEAWKFLLLAIPYNWELYGERGWSEEMDYTSKPRKFYRHKIYPYFITNAYVNEPLSKNKLVSMFITAYDKQELLFGETFYFISK